MVKELTEVTKAELARYLEVSSPMISKHVKSGILDKCFTPNGKRLYLEKATIAIKLSKRREPLEVTPQKIEDNKAICAEAVTVELVELLADAQSPSQKVQITKDYWTGKINRQKFMEQEGELMTLNQVRAILDDIGTPLSKAMDDLPFAYASRFDISDEGMEWMQSHISRIKKDFGEISI